MTQNGAGKQLKPWYKTNSTEIMLILCHRAVSPCFCCRYVQRTHSQVSPDDAVVRAPLSDAAAVRRTRHAHGAAAPVVLGTCVSLQRCCRTHTYTHIQRAVATHKLIKHSRSFVPVLSIKNIKQLIIITISLISISSTIFLNNIISLFLMIRIT